MTARTPTPRCSECGDDLAHTGRLTLYCQSCDVCEECGCPRADGFEHYKGCGLAEVESTPELPTDEVWVNVYLEDRAYGGPEEGGWYYNTAQVLRCIPTTREHAGEVKRRLEAEFSNDGRKPISSVLSEGLYAIYIEYHAGESSPQERPRYE